jgi:hypothetical protein
MHHCDRQHDPRYARWTRSERSKDEKREKDLLDEEPSQARLSAAGEAITNGRGDAKAP